MTLQSSGQIALSDLRTEYTSLGSLSEVKLSSFYYGASATKAYLPRNSCTDAIRANTDHPGYIPHLQGIPAVSNPVGNQPIRFSQFYSMTYYYAPQTDSTISGDAKTFNVNIIESDGLKSNTINSAFIDLQVNGEMRATSTGNRALTINAKNRTHTTVWVNVQSNKRILGKGGAGGNGNNGQGQSGGDAFHTSSHTFIVNNGKIYGGGGGGRASDCKTQSYNECYCCNQTNASVGGCGGGGGKGGGNGGLAGPACAANFKNDGFNGSTGDWNDSGSGGAGGSGTRCPSICIGTNPGGGGGGWGSAGGNGGAGGGAAFKKKSGLYHKFLTSGSTAGGTSGTF